MQSSYDARMAQFVTRFDDDLAAAVDELVAAGRFESRSDAVRHFVREGLDRETRAGVARRILEGYERVPETADEMAQAHAASRAMIAEEPW